MVIGPGGGRDVVDPPREFTVRWLPDQTFPGMTLITSFLLDEEDGGVRVTIRESGYEALSGDERQEWMDATGGGYTMSLYYPATETQHRGKSAEREDRVRVRFVELSPPRRIVEAVTFVTDDPAFAGEMMMTITLAEAPGGTEATLEFADLPPGLRPEDNDEGARLSLEQLARRFRPPSQDP